MFYFKRYFLRTVIFVAWCKENYALGGDVLQFIFSCTLWISVILTLLTYDYDYWIYKGMFSPPAWPVVGHIWKMATFREHSGVFFKRMYDNYKHKRFIGIHQFYRRTVVVTDPEVIRRMCINDFQHFTDRGFSFDRRLDPLAESVLYLRGNEWKALRSKISPIFSPIKLKGMLPLVDNTAMDFINQVRKLLNENETPKVGKVVSCGEMFGGYTADAIVPCAFGVKSHVMKNPEDPFAVALRAYYEFTLRNVLEKSLHYFWPAFAIFMKIRIIPKKTHDFFYNIVANVIRERQNGVHDKRGDFIDMMMALQSDERNHNVPDKDDVRITDMIISANAFIIFLGGFETTSSTLSFMFLELAEHPEVQGKMRDEIHQVLEKHGGMITYETLQDLTYMEMVIQETLRLYPPFPAIQRQCRRRYSLADGQTDTVIEPDTLVIFPTLGLHRDEQYFENASSFIPERWAEGNPPPPPGVYMPFGEGPRYCIGKRFAIIQMKCCLVKLLQHVRISPAPGRQDNSDSESWTHSNDKSDFDSSNHFYGKSESESCTHSNSNVKSDSESYTHSNSSVKSDFKSCTHASQPYIIRESSIQSHSYTQSCTQPHSRSRLKSSRREPFAADVRCPMTLHPADSRVTLSLL
ncbi:cytochrome P450 6a22-like [Aricia agestis]|uniref:cytochrome P450 6a22-like n=1 Tax=Aricia agestis TaxID=91739 RepID=UPI001C207A3D|nr:cytochrome P450 6a22-like [Aricia agestis]